MPVQALCLGTVAEAKLLRYVWTADGTVLLTLDCAPAGDTIDSMNFGQLRKQLQNLCPWQLDSRVTIGFSNAIVESLTMYHEFDLAPNPGNTLMLVCTPPEEYFESRAA